MQVIKEPLEDVSQPGGPMLDSQELRYIFGNLPPILDVHTRMRNDLLYLAHNWRPDASIGQIVLNYVSIAHRCSAVSVHHSLAAACFEIHYASWRRYNYLLLNAV